MAFKVLLPSDGSAASAHAARHVVRNLDGIEAHVLLLNVQPVFVDAEILHMRHLILGAHRKEGEKALREAREILADAGIAHEAAIAFGRVPEVIAQVARRERCDAIAMGTRARHPLIELFTGSVPKRVLRRADVPVILVRHEATRHARPTTLEVPFIAA